MRKKIYIILVVLVFILLALYNFNENASGREGVTSSKKKRDTGGETVGIIIGSVGVSILILYLTLFLYRE